jgi:hypothetical protein
MVKHFSTSQPSSHSNKSQKGHNHLLESILLYLMTLSFFLQAAPVPVENSTVAPSCEGMFRNSSSVGDHHHEEKALWFRERSWGFDLLEKGSIKDCDQGWPIRGFRLKRGRTW